MTSLVLLIIAIVLAALAALMSLIPWPNPPESPPRGWSAALLAASLAFFEASELKAP